MTYTKKWVSWVCKMYCKSRHLMWMTLLICACLAFLMMLWQKVQVEDKPDCQLSRRSRCWKISTWQWGGDSNFSFYKGFDRYYDKNDLILSTKGKQTRDPLCSVSHEMGAGNSLLKAEEDRFPFKVQKFDFNAVTLDLSDKSKTLMQGYDGNTLLPWGLILTVLICCA